MQSSYKSQTTSFKDYHSFDEAYGFAAKAGFQLSEKQIEDVHRFLGWERSLNLYDVGGGKTVVSSVVALMRGNTQKLVIVPPILITPWTAWLNKVSDGVVAYRGNPKARGKLDVGGAHWLVVSYAIFRDDFPRLERELSDSLEVIVDEAHSLKNPASVLFKKVQRLTL
jgi:superfamily II DNA or RNA helicase